MSVTAKIIPQGVFHMSDDQTPEANDAEMEKFFGPDWKNMTFGDQAVKIQDALKPLNQTFEYVMEAGWMRSNNHPVHTIAVWTTRRQTVKYLLSH
jgi:hypothetical protein